MEAGGFGPWVALRVQGRLCWQDQRLANEQLVQQSPE